MDIKDLDKRQLILLTLLITFIVSIATGIVTVSLMNQAPKSVPQTINNVIQRTIEKVTTVETPVKDTSSPDNSNSSGLVVGEGNVVVAIYGTAGGITKTDNPSGDVNTNVSDQNNSNSGSQNISNSNNDTTANNDTSNTGSSNQSSPDTSSTDFSKLGDGIIISEVGLVLVDSSILNGSDKYRVVLDKTDFDATILKQYGNGFTVLQIVKKGTNSTTNTANKSKTN